MSNHNQLVKQHFDKTQNTINEKRNCEVTPIGKKGRDIRSAHRDDASQPAILIVAFYVCVKPKLGSRIIFAGKAQRGEKERIRGKNTLIGNTVSVLQTHRSYMYL